MRQLLACHKAIAWLRQTWLAALLGLALGLILGAIGGSLLGGLIYAVSRADAVGVVVGWASGLGLCGVVLRWWLRAWQRGRALAERDCAAKVKEVLAEFPEEAQAFGGAAALRDREIVQELVRDLEASRPGAAR
jgi:hypothetical protein